MAISDKTRAMLFGKAALRCSICRELLLMESQPNVDVSLVGEICHIIARKPKGARGQEGLTEDELDSYGNLILLCQAHHKQIDDHPESFPIEELKQIKANHEVWVEQELNKLESWENNLAQINYLNIPRLSILAAMKGYKVNFKTEEGQDLHTYGWELGHILLQLNKILSDIHPEVKELPDLSNPDDRIIGLNLSFNNRFRTKNVPNPENWKGYTDLPSGDLSHDPHIYIIFGEWKLVLIINPRWITTTTAYCEFSPSGGHRLFAGLCTVKVVEYDQKVIYATPLVIGFPKSDFYEAFAAA